MHALDPGSPTVVGLTSTEYGDTLRCPAYPPVCLPVYLSPSQQKPRNTQEHTGTHSGQADSGEPWKHG